MIGSTYTVVHKSHRAQKLANKKNRRGQYVTPPKSVWRKCIHLALHE